MPWNWKGLLFGTLFGVLVAFADKADSFTIPFATGLIIYTIIAVGTRNDPKTLPKEWLETLRKEIVKDDR